VSGRLVLAVHGTRSHAGQAVCAALRDAVAERLQGVEVVLGWADVLEPRLVQTLEEVGDCVLVPVFATVGYHVAHDLPCAVRDSGGRAIVTPHVGDAILDAVAERLAEVDPQPEAVVLAAAGSLRPGSVAEVGAAARRLAAIVGCPVAPAFVTSAEPSVPDAVAAARAAGHRRVSIASYFLAPGVLSDRLETAGADVVARPVGTHPHLVEAIVERFTTSVSPETGRSTEEL
jgi:sirohydrochlorin ferrochelatase